MVEQINVTHSMFVGKHDGKLRDFYKVGKVLGEGAFGQVRVAQNRDSGAKRAVKMLNKATMDEDEKRMLFNEINILKDIDHPNIVKMYEYFEDEKRYYIVTELCKGGELFDEIIARGKFNEHDAAVLMKAVLSCINYCHQRNIVHRDLKPENILLEANKAFDQIKIIDFGTGLVYDPSNSAKLSEKLGTPYYIAPEVLGESYGAKCDIWGCGVIAYVVMSGRPPFNGKDDDEIMRAVQKGKFDFNHQVWSNVSQGAKDFISYLLTYDQNKRPTAEQALNHAWLKEATKSDFKSDTNVAIDALKNMHKFKADQTMKSASYTFMAAQLLSKSETDELAKVFRMFDKDGNGKLDMQEIKEGYFEYYGRVMSDDEVEAMFAAVDTDHSGFIDYSEFVVAAINEKKLLTEDRLKAAFKMFDKDGSGMISASEIKEVLGFKKHLNNKAVDNVMKQVDDNNDGEISYDEFVAMMKRNLAQS